MNSKDIRRGIVKARINDKNSTILSCELLIISIISGIASSSWWIFGGVLICLSVLIRIKKISNIICITISIFWGLIGYSLGTAINSMAASIVFGIIAFLIGYGTHLSAMEWFNDAASND